MSKRACYHQLKYIWALITFLTFEWKYKENDLETHNDLANRWVIFRGLEIHSKSLPNSVKIKKKKREEAGLEMWEQGQRMQKGEICINRVFACEEHSDVRWSDGDRLMAPPF